MLALLYWPEVVHATAIEKGIGLSQLSHTSWTRGREALGGSRAVLQMTDGTLLTAGPAGLMTFDGQASRSYYTPDRYPGTDIQSMCLDPAGELWLAFRSGGTFRLSQPAAGDRQPQVTGKPGAVRAIACAPDGIVWIADEQGIHRLQDTHWQRIGAEASLPEGPAAGAFASRDGAIWVEVDGTVYRRAPNAARFEPVGLLQASDAPTIAFAETPDASVWVGTAGRLYRTAVDSNGVVQLQQFALGRASALYVDAAGGLWVGGDGLRRYTEFGPGAVPERMTQANGLSGTDVTALGQDLEGAVWVATNRGLDRFWSPIYVRLVLPEGFDGSKALVASADNTLWIADARHQRALRYVGDTLQASIHVPSPQLGYAATNGTIWFAGPRGVSRISDGRVETMPMPPAARGAEVLAMAQDSEGALWVATDTPGLFRLDAAGWHSGSGISGLPEGTPTAMEVDPSGALWQGFVSGELARIERGTVRLFGPSEGLRVGAIRVLRPSGARLWIGGDQGLATYEGGRFEIAPQSNCGPLTSILDLQAYTDGAIWLYRPHTMTWVANARDDMRAKKNLQCVGGSDNFLNSLDDSLQIDRVGPKVVTTSDGRIWTVAGGRVGWTTRERLERAAPAPFSRITYLYASGADQGSRKSYGTRKSYTIDVPTVLPAGTRDLEILSSAWLFDSNNVYLFRRRLVGQSQHWQETSVWGVVFYSNLRPGQYTFEIQSRTANSAWGPVARQQITILPYFYETWWFRALVAALALVLLVGVARLLHRRALDRVHERLEVRIAERERISRELHDTLLQGVQGLMLRFQAIALRLPPTGPEARLLDDVLNRADAVLSEGRDRVAALREPPPDTNDLPQVLGEMLVDMTEGIDIRTTVTTTGKIRSLDGTVNSDIFLIVREAAANAVRHADCHELQLELSYERFWMRVRIRDDGRGIPVDYLTGGRSGHFGLASMRERARHLHGSLRIANAPDGGTELELRIPASMAYAKGGEVGKEKRNA